MNKTLTYKERSVLSGVGLAQEFWEEVVDTAKYLVNISPSLELVESTSHEVFSGEKTSISNLKVFCCDAFFHVPKEKRIKMDKK
jgi:hypothetical protein